MQAMGTSRCDALVATPIRLWHWISSAGRRRLPSTNSATCGVRTARRFAASIPRLMLGFREPGDIAAGVLERGKLAGRVEAMRPKALPPNKLIGNTTSLRTQRRALSTAKTNASDRSYDSEARAATLGDAATVHRSKWPERHSRPDQHITVPKSFAVITRRSVKCAESGSTSLAMTAALLFEIISVRVGCRCPDERN
jgi:hypothetical protein